MIYLERQKKKVRKDLRDIGKGCIRFWIEKD